MGNRRRLGLGIVLAGAALLAAYLTAAAGAGAQASDEAEAEASGYWMLDTEGRIYAFGDAVHHGRATVGDSRAVDVVGHPDGNGYWVLAAGGRVAAFGSAADLGQPDISALVPGEAFASMSTTPTGSGFWVFTDLGRAFGFGDATDHGDLVELGLAGQLNGPIVDSVATPDGGGYYMLGSDGGVFSFGNAEFAGSMGGQPLNQPVNGRVPDPDGEGYWLGAGDGGVFAFDADFRGSMGGQPLNGPVVGMVSNGAGYLMVADDGGNFNFSDRDYAGSLGGQSIPAPITAVAIVTGDPDPAPEVPTGNPNGGAAVPADAQAADVSSPTAVVGTGVPQSCTSDNVIAAPRNGGTLVFDCGPDPVTIQMTETIRIFNDTGPEIVIDGGGLVTLSGNDAQRILYMNTCDPSLVWLTARCDDQAEPRLTVQNITFTNGRSIGDDPDGGGAIFVRGGRFRAINARFLDNQCDPVGPDVAGGAIRITGTASGQMSYLVNSTFDGNTCSNGGGVGNLVAPLTILNSVFTDNTAVGNGANPARSGTPGGGNGGAIYGDGGDFDFVVAGTRVEDNRANEGGGAVFFVSNNRLGNLTITDSELRGNPSLGFETAGFPGIFYLGEGPPIVSGSVIE